MATLDGARFIGAQLDSLAAQTHRAIDVHFSDDGSTDGTLARLEAWATGWDRGRVTVGQGPREGFAANFRMLMTRPDIEADHIAFCDQDDVWEPGKLERAVAWLEKDGGQPRLYCSRTRLIAEDGSPLGLSLFYPRGPSFENAIVQSLAGGNTMVMNRAAHRLMATASARAPFVSHDWWAYMMVTGAGGAVYYDPEPQVLYRQHGLNAIGANNSPGARRARVQRLLDGQFRKWTEINVAGLDANLDLLTPQARRTFALFRQSRHGSLPARMRNLWASGAHRQSPVGTFALYVAAMTGQL